MEDQEKAGREEELREETETFSNTQDKISNTQEMYARVLEIADDAIVCIDEAQKITLFNHGAEQIFGYRANEVIGRPLDILVPSRFVEAHRRHIKNFSDSPIVARRMNQRAEVSGRRKDGTEFPAEAGISKLDVGDGKLFTVILRDMTEREALEQALQGTANALQLLLDQSPSVLWTVDRNLKITLARGAGLKALDQEPDQIEGKLLVEYFQTDDPDFPPMVAHRRALAGHAETYEYESGGRTFYSQVQPRRDTEDNIIGAIGVALDITEPKRTERLEQELAAIAQIASTVSSHLDIDQVYGRFAQEVKRLIPFERMSIISIDEGEGTWQIEHTYGAASPFVTGRSYAVEGSATGYMLHRGTTVVSSDTHDDSRFWSLKWYTNFDLRSYIEVPLRAKERIIGSVILLHREPNMFRDREQHLVESLASQIAPAIENARTFLQLQRSQEDLQESENRYRTLFEDSRDAVVINARDGQFLAANEAAVDLFGYTREDLLGLNIYTLYANPLDRRKYQEQIEKEGSIKDYEIKFRKKNGTEMDCLVTAAVRRAQDGGILGYQGIIRDITERKRAEEELQRKVNELASLNKLFQSHLQQRYEAEEAYQRIASSLAKASHEFQALIEKANKQRAEVELPLSDEENRPQLNGPSGDIPP